MINFRLKNAILFVNYSLCLGLFISFNSFAFNSLTKGGSKKSRKKRNFNSTKMSATEERVELLEDLEHAFGKEEIRDKVLDFYAKKSSYKDGSVLKCFLDANKGNLEYFTKKDVIGNLKDARFEVEANSSAFNANILFYVLYRATCGLKKNVGGNRQANVSLDSEARKGIFKYFVNLVKEKNRGAFKELVNFTSDQEDEIGNAHSLLTFALYKYCAFKEEKDKEVFLEVISIILDPEFFKKDTLVFADNKALALVLDSKDLDLKKHFFDCIIKIKGVNFCLADFKKTVVKVQKGTDGKDLVEANELITFAKNREFKLVEDILKTMDQELFSLISNKKELLFMTISSAGYSREDRDNLMRAQTVGSDDEKEKAVKSIISAETKEAVKLIKLLLKLKKELVEAKEDGTDRTPLLVLVRLLEGSPVHTDSNSDPRRITTSSAVKVMRVLLENKANLSYDNVRLPGHNYPYNLVEWLVFDANLCLEDSGLSGSYGPERGFIQKGSLFAKRIKFLRQVFENADDDNKLKEALKKGFNSFVQLMSHRDNQEVKSFRSAKRVQDKCSRMFLPVELRQLAL